MDIMSLHPIRESGTGTDLEQTMGLLQKKQSSYFDGLLDLGENAEGLKEACSQFESLFLDMLLKEFRKSIPKDGLIPRSFTVETYEEMLDNQMASDLSKSGSMGIGDVLFRQLSENMKAYQSVAGGQEKGTVLERKG